MRGSGWRGGKERDVCSVVKELVCARDGKRVERLCSHVLVCALLPAACRSLFSSRLHGAFQRLQHTFRFDSTVAVVHDRGKVWLMRRGEKRCVERKKRCSYEYTY